MVGRRKDGSLFSIDLAVGVFGMQGRQMLVASIHDITERKETERMKSEFISVVSHELRTPITSIRGSLGLILNRCSSELSADRVRELLNIAHDNCERLMILINDILDLDKMSLGQMYFDMQIVSLAALTEQAIEANAAYIHKFGVTINLTPIPNEYKIKVDTSRFIQILSNLLSNAAKFSKPSGVVDVFVTQSQGRLRVSIRDYGCGIAPAFHSRIFDKFSQEDSSATRAKGGSGLGLNISKQMVEKMNGTIGFETKVNEGTTFWIEFTQV